MHRLKRNAFIGIVVALAWLVYGAIGVLQVYEIEAAGDPNVTLAMCMQLLLPGALLFWAPMTLAFLALARRVPLTRATWLASGLTLLAAIATAILARATFAWLSHPFIDDIYPPWQEPMPPPVMFVKQAFYYSHTKILLIVFVCYLYVHLEKTHEHRLRIAELETRLTRARLDALAAQLNPHFLFNALNSIAELIHLDAEAADRMLVALGGLLRFSLASPDHEISVQAETELVAQYLSIEKIRLADRLDVRWSIAPDCEQALVPALMLQPLAENAIVHGIARRRAPGTLSISIARSIARPADTLVIEIANDGGTGGAPARGSGHGIGLSNARDRLRCLYGDAWALRLDTADDGRSIVHIELPLRFASDPAAAQAPLAPDPAAAQAPSARAEG